VLRETGHNPFAASSKAASEQLNLRSTIQLTATLSIGPLQKKALVDSAFRVNPSARLRPLKRMIWIALPARGPTRFKKIIQII